MKANGGSDVPEDLAVTYLNDGIMLAPAMLLVPEVRWSAVDAANAKDASKVTRCRWTTPRTASRTSATSVCRPAARRVWHPPEGELAYADFTLDPATVAFNVAPGE